MSSTSEIRVLSADERARLKQLAEAAIAALLPHEQGAWWDADSAFSLMPQSERRFVAAISPALALGTLAYVEQLERDLDRATRLNKILSDSNTNLRQELGEAVDYGKTGWARADALAASLAAKEAEAAAALPWMLFFRDGLTLGEIADRMGQDVYGSNVSALTRALPRIVREFCEGDLKPGRGSGLNEQPAPTPRPLP